MKYRLFLILLLSFGCTHAQEIKVTKTEDYDLVYLINRIKELSDKKTDDLSIRIFSVDNLPGSAGYPSGEVTHDLLIAVSEYDEVPEQSLFQISSLFNPKIKEWNTETDEPKVIIEYGPYDEKKDLVLRIDLQKVEIE